VAVAEAGADPSGGCIGVERRDRTARWGGAAAAFAVVGFRQIGKFEVDGEGLRDAVGVIDGESGDDFVGFGEAFAAGLFAVLNEETAQLFDDFEKAVTFLLD